MVGCALHRIVDGVLRCKFECVEDVCLLDCRRVFGFSPQGGARLACRQLIRAG